VQTCRSVSLRQYQSLRTKPHSFQETHLYQTECEKAQEEMVIVSYQLNLQLSENEAYFTKYKSGYAG